MPNLNYQDVGGMTDEVQGQIQNRSLTKRGKIIKGLNHGYAEAVNGYDWKQLQTADFVGLKKFDDTLSTFTSGDSYFPMPWYAEGVKSIQLVTPHHHVLEEKSPAEMAVMVGPRRGAVGVPAIWARVGSTAQYRALPETGFVVARSSSTENNSPVERYVRVVYVPEEAQAGQTYTEDLAGDFTVGVNLSLQVLAGWNIISVSMPAGWVGDFTLVDGASTELVRLTNGEAPVTMANNAFHFWSRGLGRVEPAPNGDYEISIAYDRVPPGLFEDYDTPEIPVSSYLVDYAISRLLQEDGRPDEATNYRRSAEVSLRRANGANPRPAGGFVPRGRNIIWATGGRQWSKTR